MKITTKILLATIILSFGVRSYASNMDNTSVGSSHRLFQVSTFGALVKGVFAGNYSFANLMKHGDFGIGTLNHLDGEMIALDSEFYQITADGHVHAIGPEEKTPFAVVTYFKAVVKSPVNEISDYKALGRFLNTQLVNKNLPYAIRIDGSFRSLKLRSFHHEHEPYPNLAESANKQAIFNLKNVEGTLVGFRFPSYMAGINVPNYHFHFISKDRSSGGHVLDLAITKGEVAQDPMESIVISLPQTPGFAEADLSKTQAAAVKAIESGAD